VLGSPSVEQAPKQGVQLPPQFQADSGRLRRSRAATLRRQAVREPAKGLEAQRVDLRPAEPERERDVQAEEVPPVRPERGERPPARPEALQDRRPSSDGSRSRVEMSWLPTYGRGFIESVWLPSAGER
jgi:hypothetical protein